MSEAHVALIVEDDPDTAAILAGLVQSIGHEARVARTLAEVRAAAEAGGYCYVLLDMEIPATAGAIPLIGSGETALALLRKRDPRRNAEHRHLLQILVVTAYSREPDFVARMYDADANGFIEKPFGHRMEWVLDRIRAALKRAGREEHAQCAAQAEPAPAEPAAEPTIRLSIDGSRARRRTTVLCDGKSRSLQDARFVVLLRLVDAHLREPGAWSSRAALGIARSPEVPSRIREAFDGALPERFELIEADGAGNHRLNPAVILEGIDFHALATHPDAAVQKIAKDRERPKR